MERVVFVTQAMGKGGTEKHLVDLIERLEPSMVDVVVLTMGLDVFTGHVGCGRGPRVQVLPGPRRGRFAASWPLLRSLKPQAVVFVNSEFPLFHWQMYLAARLSGARRVVAIEQLIAKPPADTRLRVAMRAKRRKWQALSASLMGPLRRGVILRLPGFVCNTTICVSDAVRDRLIREYGYPTKKTITCRNGVDTKYFVRDAGVWAVPQVLVGKGRGPVAVCLAQLVPSKRLDLLIHAMKKVVAQYAESCCVIVGSGVFEEQLRSIVRELGMEERVLFAGRTDDVRPYLAAADIFVLPSDREGFSLALLEAMAFGLPCVATEAGGNREAIRDGVNGFVVPRGSADALADAIVRLFGDPEARVRMGKNGRRIAEEEFDIEGSMVRVKSAIFGVE